MHLVQPPLHGQRGRVGQMCLRGRPDSLHRVVVGAVASAIERLDPAVSSQRSMARLECVLPLSSTLAMAGAKG